MYSSTSAAWSKPVAETGDGNSGQLPGHRLQCILLDRAGRHRRAEGTPVPRLEGRVALLQALRGTDQSLVKFFEVRDFPGVEMLFTGLCDDDMDVTNRHLAHENRDQAECVEHPLRVVFGVHLHPAAEFPVDDDKIMGGVYAAIVDSAEGAIDARDGDPLLDDSVPEIQPCGELQARHDHLLVRAPRSGCDPAPRSRSCVGGLRRGSPAAPP